MAVDHTVWGNTTLLQANRDQLRRTLQRKLRGYESRFELPSSRVESELSSGRLRETDEICDWVIAFRTLSALDR
jgi:hypothetical protein